MFLFSETRDAGQSCEEKRRRAVAFSLVEVTIALAILSFGILSTLSLLPLGLMSLRQASDLGAGSFAAKDIASGLMQRDYSEAATNTGPFYYDAAGAQASNANSTNYEADVVLSNPSTSDTYTNLAVKVAQVQIWKYGVNKTTQKPLYIYSFSLFDNGL